MFEEINRTNFMNGICYGGVAVPSITVNINMGERPVRRRKKAIYIDGIAFSSFDNAVSYLMADGMTSREALSYLSRREAY